MWKRKKFYKIKIESKKTISIRVKKEENCEKETRKTHRNATSNDDAYNEFNRKPSLGGTGRCCDK